jgi:hypothetical protein
MASIEVDGFLSPDIDGISTSIRSRFADIVSECEEVSRRTMQVFGQDIGTPMLSVVTAASLWTRCIRSCQAAVLLAERGMGVDALAILQIAYENLFYCAALLKRPAVISRFSGENTNSA